MENGIPGKPAVVLMDDDDDALLNDDELFLPADDASPGPDGDPVLEQFDQDIRDAEAFSQRSFGSDGDKKRRMPAFVNERVSNWNRRTWEGRNFLHHLAYYECNTRPPVSHGAGYQQASQPYGRHGHVEAHAAHHRPRQGQRDVRVRRL